MNQNIELEKTEASALGPRLEIKDFRLFLQHELVERCKKNNAYSLRSFARFLQVDPSTLSQVLRRKRKLTRKTLLRIASRLGLGPDEISRFDESSPVPLDATQSAYELTLDVFKLIADWYHYAIFELVTLQNFRSDARWIARTLGITVSEAHSAVERLQRLSLIEVDKNGRWKQGQDLITTADNPFTVSAFRKLQRQVLDKAITALEELPIAIRDQTSMTMAMNSKRIPEVKNQIKKFRRELCKYLQQDQVRDCVYNLGVSFYPLTQEVKE